MAHGWRARRWRAVRRRRRWRLVRSRPTIAAISAICARSTLGPRPTILAHPIEDKRALVVADAGRGRRVRGGRRGGGRRRRRAGRLARAARALRVGELWTDCPLLAGKNRPAGAVELLDVLRARHPVRVAPAGIVDALTATAGGARPARRRGWTGRRWAGTSRCHYVAAGAACAFRVVEGGACGPLLPGHDGAAGAVLLHLVLAACLAVPIVPAGLVRTLAASAAVALRVVVVLPTRPVLAGSEAAACAVLRLVILAREAVRVEPTGRVGARHSWCQPARRSPPSEPARLL